MALPKQVQQQLEEAERIQQQLAGTPAAEPDPGDTPPADPQPSPPPAEPPVVAAPEPTPPAPPADDGWKQRYETLRGKYDAEVTRLHEMNRTTSAQLQALQQQLAALQQTRPSEPPKEPETPLVTTKDEETFGSDLVDVMRRVSREESRALSARLDRLEQLARNIALKAERVDQVEQRVVQSQEQLFWSELAKAVPNWQEINADQRWLSWLTEVDPILGRPRQEALNEAQQALNHQRVAAMFNLFLRQVAPPTPSQPNQAQAELARQVAPAKSSKTTVQPQSPKQYTGQEYQYWLDPRRVHDTDSKQLQAMISEMERALMENRIRW